MPDDFESNDWVEYKRLVLEGLGDMKGFRKDVNTQFDALTKEVTILKTEIKHIAGRWALLAGAGVALLVSLAVPVIIHFLTR